MRGHRGQVRMARSREVRGQSSEVSEVKQSERASEVWKEVSQVNE
ncbi:hypothetical protein Pcinc_017038, partial [Petrolisthes cinctipes]